MDLSRVEVVLVRPARPANVAAACRAMKNMGLRALWLADAARLRVDAEARALAYGAWDVLDGARHAASLSDAVAGSTLVAGTTGRPLRAAVAPRRLAAEADARVSGGRLSIVFGPEASGLTAAELALCHVLVHVPTDPEQPSLNLAQAVLLLAYELRLAALPARDAAAEPAAVVSAAALEQAVQELRAALLEIGYLDAGNPDRILTELRRLFARAGLTARELTLLRGVARQVSWAGRVARARPGKR
jgi:TrmH family RNA methyltransferase